MGGDGGEVLGYYLGEGVKRGPASNRIRTLRLEYVRETDAGRSMLSWDAYHGGRGSMVWICCCREAREFVSWARRWRVCSSVLMS